MYNAGYLQNWFYLKITILFNKINIIIYFKNKIVKLCVFYIFHAYFKFYINQFYIICYIIYKFIFYI